MPRRSLAELLEREGFPGTQRLLMWGRLIVAGHLLEDTRRSADRVSESLGFPSGSAFRNSCKRYVGLAPGEIRAGGGSACVTDAFMRQLRRAAPVALAAAAPPAADPPLAAGPKDGPPAVAGQPPKPPGARPTPRDATIWRFGKRLAR
jgi:hypothetical protein